MNDAPPEDASPPAAPHAAAGNPPGSERVRPVHVVPGGAGAAAGPVPAFVAAVQARDAAAARAALSPSFRGTANGRPLDADGQVRLLESFWTGFPDAPLRMEATGGSGRHVITWSLSGAQGGFYLGVPPTGAAVSLSGFIVAVSDATGITSLDWKWDTKAFTKAVLGPDQVGELEVKDTFRDPSRRWQNEGARRGPGKGKGKGGRGQPGGGRQPGGQRAPGPRSPAGEAAPTEGQAQEGAPGAEGAPRPPRQPGQPGPPSPPGQGKRRRRGKGPRGPGAPLVPGAAVTQPQPEGGAAPQPGAPSAAPVPAESPAAAPPAERPGEGA